MLEQYDSFIEVELTRARRARMTMIRQMRCRCFKLAVNFQAHREWVGWGAGGGRVVGLDEPINSASQ